LSSEDQTDRGENARAKIIKSRGHDGKKFYTRIFPWKKAGGDGAK